MGLPAAKVGDRIVGTDVHIVLVSTPFGTIPTPTPSPFDGQIVDGAPTVLIEGRPAAVVGSTAVNTIPHIPAGGSFANPPQNRGTVTFGSTSVLIGGRPAARLGDPANTCNDTGSTSTVMVGASTVQIG